VRPRADHEGFDHRCRPVLNKRKGDFTNEELSLLEEMTTQPPSAHEQSVRRAHGNASARRSCSSLNWSRTLPPSSTSALLQRIMGEATACSRPSVKPYS